MIEELYLPCLKWAERFDRGVGFFTTGWISCNIEGMSGFASRGGKVRLITSPILSNDDTDAIIHSEHNDTDAYKKFEAALFDNVKTLEKEMNEDILNAFSWMLYDGIIMKVLKYLRHGLAQENMLRLILSVLRRYGDVRIKI